MLFIVMVVMAGCGQGESVLEKEGAQTQPVSASASNQQSEIQGFAAEDTAGISTELLENTTPATLKFAVHLPINEEFERLYVEPVTEKYPHITLEMSRVSNFKTYDEILAAGEVPDMYISFNGNMPGLKDRGINMDMSELFKKHNLFG